MFILVGMAELTAAGKYINYWLPDIPVWVSVAVFLLLLNLINLINVRMYGETEFWFAIIKSFGDRWYDFYFGSYLLVEW